MIIDQRENFRMYTPLGSRIAAGLEYLGGLAPADFREQTVEIDGRDIYAMFQTYTTEGDSGRFYEAHQRYIDIQCILSGSETIRVASIAPLEIQAPYDPERDVAFYHLAPGTDVILQAGGFAILYPHEGHLPKLPTAEPATVKKVVVKVRI